MRNRSIVMKDGWLWIKTLCLLGLGRSKAFVPSSSSTNFRNNLPSAIGTDAYDFFQNGRLFSFRTKKVHPSFALSAGINEDIISVQEDFSSASGAVAAAAAASVSSSSFSSTPTSKSRRYVARTEKFARLPVWPVWMGVILFFVGQVNTEWSAKVEDWVGGRVCPNFFPDPQATSPFIMLVHHRHSFAPLDPIRWIQKRFILPEGFPAHPHRGFTTLTYFLKGGFQHRDSMGVSQRYGARPENRELRRMKDDKKKYPTHHSQWLFTGAGLLHEEMFDESYSKQQELYQLWVNVPANRKLDAPSVDLLGDDECPRVKTMQSNSSETIVLAGSYQENSAATPIMSDMAIFHVSVDPDKTWSYDIPKSFETAILYIRQGSCNVEDTIIPAHHTAYLESIGEELVVSATSKGVDFLLLAGAPLREPVAAQGSMVMNSDIQIQQAYQDYQVGSMGMPWSHELSDEEWRQHVQQFPCRYPYSIPRSNSDL